MLDRQGFYAFLADVEPLPRDSAAGKSPDIWYGQAELRSSYCRTDLDIDLIVICECQCSG
jgi:hypothetical protein